MQKKIIITLFALILIFIAFAIATPVVNVTEPDAGERIQIGNTKTLSWTVSDITNPQELTASIWYSVQAGDKDNPIASNINLLGTTYCYPPYGYDEIWVLKDYDWSGTEPWFLATSYTKQFLTYFKSGMYDGKLLWLTQRYGVCYSGYIDATTGDTVQNNLVPSAYFCDVITTPETQRPYEWNMFYLPEGTSPSFLRYEIDYDGDPEVATYQTYDWNGAGWSEDTNSIMNWFDYTYRQFGDPTYCSNYSGNSGYITKQDAEPFSYDGKYWYITEATPCLTTLTYNWEGWRNLGYGLWTKDNTLIGTGDGNLNAMTANWSKLTGNGAVGHFREWGDNLYFLGLDEFKEPAALVWGSGSSKWFDVPDFNKGILAEAFDVCEYTPTWDGAEKTIIYDDEPWWLQMKDNKHTTWNINPEVWNSEDQRTCDYPNWLVTGMEAGDYYIDIEIDNGIDTGLDSSGQFEITTEYVPPEGENEAFEVTKISGFTEWELQTANDLNIVSTGEDLIYKVKHIRLSLDTLTHHLFDTDPTKQYWIYKIECGYQDNCLTYQQENWTFDAGRTLEPIQKIWNGTSYEHTFSQAIIQKDYYIYYKLVYKEPMRHWETIGNSGDWLNLNTPSNTTYDGKTYDGYLASFYNNIYSRFLIPIPTLESDCSGQPECYAYEFQFTAFADEDATEIKVLSMDANGYEHDISTITLSTEPERYTAKVYDDYLVFKTVLTGGAAQIKIGDYALLQRGYFKTDLEIKTTTGSELPAARHGIYTQHTPTDYNASGIIFSEDVNIGQTFTTGEFLDEIAMIKVWIEKDWWLLDAGAIIPVTGSLYADSSKAELLGTTIGYTVGTPYNITCTGGIFGGISIATLSWCPYTLAGGEPVEFDFGILAEPNTEYYVEFSADFSTLTSTNKEAGLKFSTTDLYEGQTYSNGSPLSTYDLKMGIEEIGVFQWIDEGEEFKAVSSAWNGDTGEGLANRLRIRVFKEEYSDENRMAQWDYEIPETAGAIDLDKTLSGIIDRLDITNPIEVFLTMELCNDTYCFEEIGTEFKVMQFPSSNEDIILGIDNYETKMGYYPRGRIRLQTTNPESVLGVELTLIKTPQLGAKTLTEIIAEQGYHYKTDFYKNRDFACNVVGDCGFDFYITDWVFGDADEYLWNVTVILNTKETNYEDYLTNTFKTFITQAPDYSLVQLTEQYARTQTCTLAQAITGACYWDAIRLGVPTPNYRNNENTRWVLTIKDFSGNDIRDDLKISMQIQDCGYVYDCNGLYSEPDPETLLYSPSSSTFNQTTGSNIFYFETLLIEDNGQLLENGHFYRMIATIEDTSGLHEEIREAYLEQLENPFYFENEIKFYINNAYVCQDSPLKTCLPQLQCFACSAVPDESEIDQDITCVGVYTKSEIPIDTFETTIGNQYSDYSEDDLNAQQYIKFNVSWDSLINQNIDESWDTMTLSYPQLALDRTIGSLILYGIKYLGGDIPFNLMGEAIDAGLLVAWALDTNTLTGTRTDCNFNIPVNSAMGIVGYEIHGIRILNQNDYPELEGVDSSKLFKYAAESGITLPQYTTTVDIYAGITNFVERKTIPSRLVINEAPSVVEDLNTGATLPNYIHFDLTQKMYYNNFTSSMQSFIPLNYVIYLPPTAADNPLSIIVGAIINIFAPEDTDGDGTISENERNRGLQEGMGKIAKLILENVVWFIVILGVIMIIAFLIRAIKGAG